MANTPVLGIAAAVVGTQKFIADLQLIRKQINLAAAAITKQSAATTAAVTKQSAAATAAVAKQSAAIMAIARVQASLTATRLSLVATGKSWVAFGSVVRNTGNRMAQIGSRLTLAFTGLFALISIGSGKAAADFESSMAKIVNLVGVAEDEVAQLSKSVIDIAPELGATPQELSEALFVITSAGIRDVAEAQDVLTKSAQASAIGLGEIKEVARITTAVLQAYAGTGIDAGRATDVLTAIVREGNLEAEKLAPSLGRVIPIASQLGVSFEEVGAFIATFTRLGVPASVAVTSLRSAMSSILKPTSAASEELEKYGITSQDVRDSLADPNKGLARTLIDLTTVLAQDDESLSKVIGNIRGLSGVLGVASTLADDYVEILGSINDSNGIVADGFERVAQTTTFQWNQAKAAVSVAAIEIGSAILPTLNEMLQGLVRVAEAVAEFARLNPELTETAIRFLAIAAVVGPVVFIIGTLVAAIGGAISTIGTLLVLLGGLAAALLSVKGIIGGLVIAFISLFVDIDGEATNFFDGFAENMFDHGRNIVEAFSQGMTEGLIAVVDALTQIAQTITYWLESLSPPRLLPDLDKWGANALTAYMDGWAQGDFSVFEEIFGTIESFLSAVPGINRKELPNLLLGFGQSLAESINEIRDTGRVTDEAINRITSAVAEATPEVEEYVRAVFDAALANDRFAIALAPIDARLQEISDRRKEIENELETEKLGKILADVFADPRSRELAELRLEEIELEEQKSAIERRRDIELKLARERLEIAKSMLDIQADTNDLLKQILEELKKDKKKPRRAGVPKGGAGRPRLPGGIGAGGVLSEAERRLIAKLDAADAIGNTGGVLSRLSSDMERLTKKIDEMRDAFDDLKEAIRDNIPLLATIAIGFLIIRAIGLGPILLFLGRVLASVVIPAIMWLGRAIVLNLVPAIWAAVAPLLAFLAGLTAIPLLILIALAMFALLIIKFGGIKSALEESKMVWLRWWWQIKEIFRLLGEEFNRFVTVVLPAWKKDMAKLITGLAKDFFDWAVDLAQQFVAGFLSVGIGRIIADSLNLPQAEPGNQSSGGDGGLKRGSRTGSGSKTKEPPSLVGPSMGFGGGVTVVVNVGEINNAAELDDFSDLVTQSVADALR